MAFPWINPGGGPDPTQIPQVNPGPIGGGGIPPVPRTGWNRPVRPDLSPEMQAWQTAMNTWHGARPERTPGLDPTAWHTAMQTWLSQRPERPAGSDDIPKFTRNPPVLPGGQPGAGGDDGQGGDTGQGTGQFNPYAGIRIYSPTPMGQAMAAALRQQATAWDRQHGVYGGAGPGRGTEGDGTTPPTTTDPTQVGSGTPGLTDWQAGRRGFGGFGGFGREGVSPVTRPSAFPGRTATGAGGTTTDTSATGYVDASGKTLTGKALQKALKNGTAIPKVAKTAPASTLQNPAWVGGFDPGIRTPGFHFPQYTQQWALNPDIFGRIY